MKYENRYSYRARINENTVRKLVRHYADGLDASSIADNMGLNRNTVNRYLQGIRKQIPSRLPEVRITNRAQGVRLSVTGESYRIKYKRTKLAQPASVVLGVQLHSSEVLLWIITGHHLTQTLRGIIRGSIPREHVLEWGYLAKFEALIDVGQNTAYPIDPTNSHQMIDEFWSLTKARLALYRGIKHELLKLYLNECLFRFNHRNEDLYSLLIDRLKQQPLFHAGNQAHSELTP